MKTPFKNHLCVALDVDEISEVNILAEQLATIVGGFKVGPRLIQKYGELIVKTLSEKAPVFVDCKFFDIPSTMLASVQAVFDSGASACTVHALSGQEALSALAELEKKLNSIRPFQIFAVTILTSWNQKSLPSSFLEVPIVEHVQKLAILAKDSGIKSIVCSAEEIKILKPTGLFLLTPGIRLAEDSKDDQKRSMGPQEALKCGANVLVVGRPIIKAHDPKSAALKFL